jgi:8-oxo-(d)GTP phosphatase
VTSTAAVRAPSSALVIAAGGVVWRPTSAGIRIALIHRPHRGDWSLPKGKLDHDERLPACAVREVVEETGLRVALQHQLGSVRYRTGGYPKTVTYWAMRYRGGRFVANDEADQLRWVAPAEAADLLTFAGDNHIVERFTEIPLPDSTVLLVRHAKAGRRSAWKKEDSLRPIDAGGRRQAVAVATFAELLHPRWIAAATLVRCSQTVRPLAEALGRKVHAARDFTDAAYAKDPRRANQAMMALADKRRVSLICSQGDTIPQLVQLVDPSRVGAPSHKGSVWALFFADGSLVAADYYRSP